MTMSKSKAAAKKKMFLNNIKNKVKTSNKGSYMDRDYDYEDSDGSISSDDVDVLEEEYLGNIIKEQYIIIKYIGKGTFSKVWLVFDLINEKFIIFKIYFKDDKDEFETELKTLDVIKLNNMGCNLNYEGHLVHEFIINNNIEIGYILIMPYLGLSLADILEEVEELSLLETKYVIKQVLKSLLELHKCKYVHTDLKTDNILTDIYSEKNTEYVEWFKTLNIPNQYKDILKLNSPSNEELLRLDKNKRKILKRKIKKRSIKSLSLYIKKKLNNYDVDLLNINTIDLNIHNNIDKEDNIETTGDKEEDIETNMSINHIELDKIDLNTVCIQPSNNDNNNDNDNKEYNIINTNFTLIDYSNALHIDEIENDDELQIRAYRSPENILGMKYSYRSELWAVGCILWDILTGDYIFEPKLIGSAVSRDREQLSLMEKYLGRIPKEMSFECEKFYELFDDSGKIKKHRKIDRNNLEGVLKEKREDLNDKEISEICVFLRKIWIYNPTTRLNINQIINDEFLINI